MAHTNLVYELLRRGRTTYQRAEATRLTTIEEDGGNFYMSFVINLANP